MGGEDVSGSPTRRMTRSMSRSTSSPNTAEPKLKPKSKPKPKPDARKARGETSMIKESPEKMHGPTDMGEEIMENDFFLNARKVYLKDKSGYAKRQCDSMTRHFFPLIQERRKEIADYVLVEPLAYKTILVGSCWGHMNFRAKPKDADDSTSAMFFAEMDTASKEVTSLTRLDIDNAADNAAYKKCPFCHPDPSEVSSSVGGYGCVYHPIDLKIFGKFTQ